MPKILVIEDDPIIGKMYKEILSFGGLEVVLGVGGREGLYKVKSEKPDIVLLDIMMPEPNGMEILTTIKSDPTTKDIPVVMLSNLSGKNDAKLALSKGAVEYWVKSEIEVKNLAKMVKQIIGPEKQKPLVKDDNSA